MRHQARISASPVLLARGGACVGPRLLSAPHGAIALPRSLHAAACFATQLEGSSSSSPAVGGASNSSGDRLATEATRHHPSAPTGSMTWWSARVRVRDRSLARSLARRSASPVERWTITIGRAPTSKTVPARWTDPFSNARPRAAGRITPRRVSPGAGGSCPPRCTLFTRRLEPTRHFLLPAVRHCPDGLAPFCGWLAYHGWRPRDLVRANAQRRVVSCRRLTDREHAMSTASERASSAIRAACSESRGGQPGGRLRPRQPAPRESHRRASPCVCLVFCMWMVQRVLVKRLCRAVMTVATASTARNTWET